MLLCSQEMPIPSVSTNFSYVLEQSLLIASGPENYFEMKLKQ